MQQGSLQDRHTHPRRCSPGLPSSTLTSSPAYLPALLGHVISSLRFLGDNQPGFLISLPLNPFPSQSIPPQMLKQMLEALHDFSFPPSAQLTEQVTNLFHPKNSSQNFPCPSIPPDSLPFLAPRIVTGSELCPICISEPSFKI